MSETRLPIKATSILIPKEAYQNSHWPVVACDQYTSEPAYWEKLARENAETPSTLHLILPEYVLEEKGETNCQAELACIWQTMDKYMEKDIFQSLEAGYILCSRLLPDGKTKRNGVVLAIDLDSYLYTDKGEPSIKASEATVESRLPSRIAIREGASLELPHVLLLIDDPDRQAVEGLVDALAHTEKALYSIALPENAGQVTAYFVPETSEAAAVFQQKLAALPSFLEHGLFSYVGDGNHSLAAAKRIRETQIKNGNAQPDAASRYALVELINIHDPGLISHPIHQLTYHTKLEAALDFAKNIFKDEALHLSEAMDFTTAYNKFMDAQLKNGHTHTLILRQGTVSQLVTLEKPKDVLAISAAHRWSGGMQEVFGKRIDYIHGEQSLAELSEQDHLAIYLPTLQKRDFFPALEKLNVLPKKTFSLGEAAEKRHYIEARCIK